MNDAPHHPHTSGVRARWLPDCAVAVSVVDVFLVVRVPDDERHTVVETAWARLRAVRAIEPVPELLERHEFRVLDPGDPGLLRRREVEASSSESFQKQLSQNRWCHLLIQ